MNDATQGSVETGNPAGSADSVVANAAANAADAANGSGKSGDWWTGLRDEGNLKLVEAKGWTGKSLDDVASSYRELESRLGKALVPPKEDATPEEWQSFFGKLGRPEKADGYQFKMPDGLPENLPYDANSADKFKLWAHEAGLTPKQAQAVHDKYVGDFAHMFAARQEAEGASVAQSHEKLVKMWGDPESEAFKKKNEYANRSLRQNGGEELTNELKTIGVLAADGSVKSPLLANFLAKVGETLYAEDALYGGPNTQDNPFAKGKENLTLQGQIIRADPERARVLIRQSGQDPKDWTL
jgi:hypothetical protein